jgi:hypothetical protein
MALQHCVGQNVLMVAVHDDGACVYATYGDGHIIPWHGESGDILEI